MMHWSVCSHCSHSLHSLHTQSCNHCTHSMHSLHTMLAISGLQQQRRSEDHGSGSIGHHAAPITIVKHDWAGDVTEHGTEAALGSSAMRSIVGVCTHVQGVNYNHSMVKDTGVHAVCGVCSALIAPSSHPPPPSPKPPPLSGTLTHPSNHRCDPPVWWGC